MMSLQEYQPPIYQIPNHPSQRLKVVLDYLDNVKRWDFDALSKQFTPDFTLQILPASLRLSPRTKSQYIESLHTLRDSLNGAPLEMIIYEVDESKSNICFYMFLKSVNLEGIFNFRFGTGRDENLIANLTEFIDSKMYAGGNNSGDSDGRSGDGR